MSLHAAAQHLASKGRNGDTTLVHMTKGEVAGLQAIAKQNGASLTTNPHTGLPEAFSLKSLIPIAAGLMLGPAGFGIAGSAMGAGLMVGGATALGTGSLKQGLIAGLGAYGGAGLGEGIAAGSSSITGPGAGGVPVTDVVATPGVTATPVVGPSPLSTSAELGSINSPYAATSTNTIPQLRGATTPGSEMFSDMGQTGVSAQPVVTPTQPTGLMDARTTYDPSFKPATYSGPTEASLKTPSTFDQIAANAEANPKLMAYAAAPAISEELTPAPYNPEKANVDSDMGQRLGYESGYDPSIPGRTASPSYTQISGDEAKRRYGFADGGEIQYPYGESVLRMADGGATAPSAGYEAGPYTAQDANTAAYGLGTGIDYSGYDTAPNQGIMAALPQGNPNQNIIDLYKAADSKRMAEEAEAEEKRIANSLGGFAAGGGISTLGGYSDGGRLLKGPGDGVSDSIPAVIGRKQPARLADGEFVVPARIVSEIGNGSTEAGARKLYAMMDRVQKARGKTVGKGKVAKNSRADKYLPA